MPSRDGDNSEAAAPRPSGGPIRVSVLHVEPLRTAGLMATFEGNLSIKLAVEEPGNVEAGEWPNGDSQVALVGTRLGSGTHRWIESLHTARPELNILVVSPAAGDEAILDALTAGAQGFLHEAATAAQFESAIRAVASGTMWAPRRVLGELIARLLAARQAHASPGNSVLTAREKQVLDLILDGRSNREIAEALGIEERTVKSYVTRLLRKKGVKNRTALSVMALAAKERR